VSDAHGPQRAASGDPGTASSRASKGARLWEIDALRGTAVLAMMVFHFAWDWAYLHDSWLGSGSRYYSGAIAITFITLLGVSISLDRRRVRAAGRSTARRTAQRFALIGGSGLLVTLGTLFVMPSAFVYFGILHLLAICTLLVGLTAPLGAVVNALLGLAVLAAGASGFFDGPAPSAIVSFVGWRAPRAAIDWYPLVPWAGFAFLGFAAGLALYPGGRRRLHLPDWSRPTAPLRFLGRHALPIYLVHQLVLFPLAWVLAIGLA
jgi:uncharacterized membrane protein